MLSPVNVFEDIDSLEEYNIHQNFRSTSVNQVQNDFSTKNVEEMLSTVISLILSENQFQEDVEDYENKLRVLEDITFKKSKADKPKCIDCIHAKCIDK